MPDRAELPVSSCQPRDVHYLNFLWHTVGTAVTCRGMPWEKPRDTAGSAAACHDMSRHATACHGTTAAARPTVSATATLLSRHGEARGSHSTPQQDPRQYLRQAPRPCPRQHVLQTRRSVLRQNTQKVPRQHSRQVSRQHPSPTENPVASTAACTEASAAGNRVPRGPPVAPLITLLHLVGGRK